MIATLYDIHGNLAALEAVLAEVPGDATIVVGGDVCAGGAKPSEVLTRLRDLGDRVVWLRGNADRELTRGEEAMAPQEVIDETRAQLGEDEIAFLYSLPPTQRLGDILFCHASPRNDVDIFTERTPDDRLAPLYAGLDVSTVVCGHTHTQFERVVAGVRIVNSGSVGMPYEDQPGAYWRLDLEPRYTPYEGAELSATREEAVAHFTEIGL
jgi:putative phosphoesterase